VSGFCRMDGGVVLIGNSPVNNYFENQLTALGR
jgi:hypothetical protein